MDNTTISDYWASPYDVYDPILAALQQPYPDKDEIRHLLDEKHKIIEIAFRFAAEYGLTEIIQIFVNQLKQSDPAALERVLSHPIPYNNPLVLAADAGHKDTVNALVFYDGFLKKPQFNALLLLLKKFELNDKDKNSAFMWMIRIGLPSFVQNYTCGPNFDVIELKKQDKLGYTALHWAAVNGHEEIIPLLEPLLKTEDWNRLNHYGWTALMLAAWNGYPEIVNLLIPNTTDLSRRDHELGNTALHWAVVEEQIEVIEVLAPCLTLEILNQKNKAGLTALNLAQGHRDKTIEKSIAHYISVAEQNKKAAFEDPCVQSIQKILATDDEPYSFKSGYTVLIYAARFGHTNVIETIAPYLTSEDWNACLEDGKNALMCAAWHGHIEAAKILIPHTKQLNKICTTLNYSAIHFIVLLQSDDLIHALGPYLTVADWTAPNINGDTAWNLAGTRKRALIAKYIGETGERESKVLAEQFHQIALAPPSPTLQFSAVPSPALRASDYAKASSDKPSPITSPLVEGEGLKIISAAKLKKNTVSL